jgi:hypothetical protein
MLVNFRTGYFDLLGNLVVSNKPCVLRYLKGWFIVDLLSTIPVDWIDWDGNGSSISGTQAFKTAKITKAIKVIRLLRLTKLMKSSVYADQIEEWLGVQKSKLNVARTLFMMMVLAHFVSCFWAFTGSLHADETMVWWDAYSQMLCEIESRLLANGVISADKSGEFFDWYTAPLEVRYEVCLYWSITTITTVPALCFMRAHLPRVRPTLVRHACAHPCARSHTRANTGARTNARGTLRSTRSKQRVHTNKQNHGLACMATW